MRSKHGALVALATVLIIASVAFAGSLGTDAEDTTPSVLIDMGNGITYWTDADMDQQYQIDVLRSALTSLDLTYKYETSGFVVDGRTPVKIGSTNTSWLFFVWDGVKWKETKLNTTSEYSGEDIALGFYPSGTAPVENPIHKTSWTMIRGDAEQTGHQTADMTYSGNLEHVFDLHYEGQTNYVCATTLIAGNKLFVVAGGNSVDSPVLYCYDKDTLKEEWSFEYPVGVGYETATGLIVGDYYYLPATNGTLYKIPLESSSMKNSPVKSMSIPMTYDHALVGNPYATGPATLTYDSGMLYFGINIGYVYCVDLDLNLIWKAQVGGCMYFMSTTVVDGIVYAGSLNGDLYLIDAVTGKILTSETVYSYEKRVNIGGKYEYRTYGQAAVSVIVDGVIYVSFSDGQGMNTAYGGMAGYRYDRTTNTLIELFKVDAIGITGSYLLPTEAGDGVYFSSLKVPLGKMYPNGTYEVLNNSLETVKAPILLLNDGMLIVSEYKKGGSIFHFDLNGNVINSFKQPDTVANNAMAAPVVIGDITYIGTDGGFYVVKGLGTENPVDEKGSFPWLIVLLIVLLSLFAIYCIYIWKTKKISPFRHIKKRVSEVAGFNNEKSKTKRNKKRLTFVLILGIILAFIMFMCCLSFGPSGTIPLGEALSSLISAISKGGQNLTYNEVIVYESRLPRAIAAIGVGMGLAVAGSIYQAIIRNPLVDPYIMGVSSGAGTMAVAALAANFTFFGLLSGNFVTPILAIVGGVVAFFITMLIAEKSGGSSTNFVLAGVVVGLAFSSLMTIMLVTAQSDKLHSALSWLYGSFANIGWDTVWLVFFPAFFMSLVPLFWAKELNLVLLGEDQAKQMGLNVRVFNRWMLIFASILTAVCVAFVGIIGFVGLVVPHMCRMILGGDHRLMLPASIVMGAVLMLFADLLARMIMIPQELPVGAITTMIGVPLFAYLLIRRGRMYDG